MLTDSLTRVEIQKGSERLPGLTPKFIVTSGVIKDRVDSISNNTQTSSGKTRSIPVRSLALNRTVLHKINLKLATIGIEGCTLLYGWEA